MRDRVLRPTCVAALLMSSACGPLTTPMPVHLDAAHQASVDGAWNDLLTPVDHYNDQAILDVMFWTAAFQLGVDRLDLRTEKHLSDGRIVAMEVHSTLNNPDDDVFSIVVQDAEGHALRTMRYDRKTVERSFNDLTVRTAELRSSVDAGRATQAELDELKAINARNEAVKAIVEKFKPPKESS